MIPSANPVANGDRAPTTHPEENTMATYQGKPVTVVRPVRKGDQEFDEDIDQLVIKLEDGSEKTVERKDVQEQGGKPGGGQHQR